MPNATTILITGGAGFIGSNLTGALLAEHHKVICLDNFSTGRRCNIEPYLNHPDYRLLKGDIRDSAACEEAMRGVDYVLHHAALGSVPRSVKDPVSTISVNTTGFVTVLAAARQAGVKRVVYASSSSVYGDSAALPKVENATGNALSPYAASKQADELFAQNFALVYDMELIGLRYFNVFGPHQDPAGAYAAVIPRFMTALLEHRAPVIYGDGSNSRDFTYVENVIQANRLAMTAPREAVNQVYNIACGDRITLLELFGELKKLIGAHDAEASRIEPEFAPPRTGDIPHSHADISKAGRLLGYHPQYDVRRGLALAAEWYAADLKKKN